MPKDQLEQQTEQDEFDAAWNGVDDIEESTDDEGDTSEDAADVEEDELDEELDEQESDDEADDTDEEGEADESQPEPDDKETQRLKSWEGRLKAEETRIKRDREEWERRQQETYANKNDGDNPDQDTDNSPDEFESEFPEFAQYAKQQAVAQTKPLQDKLTAYEQEKAQQQAEAHTNRIKASHPDAFDVAQSPAFDEWIENQPFKVAQQYIQVKQQGTADEVIAMLDDFKSQSTKPKPKPTPPSSVKTRRTAKPKGRVAKSDFDGAWDEATS